MVPTEGIEPPILAAAVSKTAVYTISTTSARLRCDWLLPLLHPCLTGNPARLSSALHLPMAVGAQDAQVLLVRIAPVAIDEHDVKRQRLAIPLAVIPAHSTLDFPANLAEGFEDRPVRDTSDVTLDERPAGDGLP